MVSTDAEILNDPLVKALLAMYPSARIVPGSIKHHREALQPVRLPLATDLQIGRYSPSYLLLRELQRDPARLDSLTWRQFEKLVADLLERDGYEVELMRGTKDGGVDVVATKHLGVHGSFRSLWQAKHLGRTSRVQLSVVRELADTRNEFKATKAIIVTSSFLTRGALQRVARDKWWLGKVDRADLDAWIQRLLRDEHRRLTLRWSGTSTGMALGPRGVVVHHPPRGPSAIPASAPQLKR